MKAVIAGMMLACLNIGCARVFTVTVTDKESGQPATGYWVSTTHVGGNTFYRTWGPRQLNAQGQATERIGLFDYDAGDTGRGDGSMNVHVREPGQADSPCIANFSCSTPDPHERVRMRPIDAGANAFIVYVEAK